MATRKSAKVAILWVLNWQSFLKLQQNVLSLLVLLFGKANGRHKKQAKQLLSGIAFVLFPFSQFRS